ncbi:MAG TPA: UbiA family prenyltransferase [Thermoanaerobaculia bacterium]|nr:UbiA family prenyltransferase [Thermoanaerobaculia bacterium]HUM31165.1 UbiA family prenyltransferase [Thermoanaerobaculia bacterium]HXK69535.1 UbiA family prenyltransferase [Thermoanaerobaculia bacterium]
MKLGLYSRFTRPFTLLPPLMGILSGAVCAFGSIHNPDPERRITLSLVLVIVLGSLCASLLNAASNVINQIYDLEIDRKNKPSRPLVTGEISMRSAWIYGLWLYVLALVPTWLVVTYPYTTWSQKFSAPLIRHETFFIYLVGLLFTFIYSAPFLGRTKRLGIWANITIAIPRGVLLKVAGWTFVASMFSTEPWFIGSIFGLFLLGASSTKDFSDMEGDRLGGCITMPIRYGVRKAVYMISPSFIFPWLLMPLGAWMKDPLSPEHTILTGNPYILTGLGIGLCLWGIYTVSLLLKDPDALATVENHPSWTHMYAMMMAAQVGFALAYLF